MHLHVHEVVWLSDHDIARHLLSINEELNRATLFISLVDGIQLYGLGGVRPRTDDEIDPLILAMSAEERKRQVNESLEKAHQLLPEVSGGQMAISLNWRLDEAVAKLIYAHLVSEAFLSGDGPPLDVSEVARLLPQQLVEHGLDFYTEGLYYGEPFRLEALSEDASSWLGSEWDALWTALQGPAVQKALTKRWS